MTDSDARGELGGIAASLRAYLEWQESTGAVGIPRRPKDPIAATTAAASALVTETSTSASSATLATATSTAAPQAAAPPPHAAAHAPDPAAHATAGTPAPTAPLAAAPPAPAPRALTVIAEEVRACSKCSLAPTRTNTVFSRGNPEAKLVFVGEAPGADEDAQGLPFVGRAGQLLDKMIEAMGLDPENDVYVCNIIKCRPPGNRRPEPEEIEACIPYLHEQLAAIAPRVIVAMGNTAVGALLGTKIGITKVRGNWKLYRGRIPVMPTYHPSYLIRPSAQQKEAKRQAWEDLQAVMKELGLPPRKP
jgi:DNA polymerase